MNSCRKEPWPVFLTNFDEANSDISEFKQSKLKLLDGRLSLKADLTILMPNKRIVDRVREPGIENHASRVVAEQEGLQCRKLPLDQYLEWQSGNKMLTLTAVLAILQDVYDLKGDWRCALLKNIPVRNLRKPDEINQTVKRRNQEKIVHQKEVLRVLTENSPPNIIAQKALA
uniref:SAM-dependent MTase TRM10-type domain-containing protein n=1 Tax=Ditylenchus dipsaci TaxID=166011 RepID=A0A915DZ23_9BILA